MPPKQRLPKRMATGKVTATYMGLRNDGELKQARSDRVGRFATLPFYKIGSRVMYDLNEVDDWIDQHKVERAA